MGARYILYNFAMGTTAVPSPDDTGTAIKTMLQLATAATSRARIWKWGFELETAPTAASIIQLIQTDVAATNLGTAHAASGAQKLDPASPDAILTYSTSGTGFGGTPTEGSITATRLFDQRDLVANPDDALLYYEKEWYDEASMPVIAVSSFLRVRVDMGSDVNGFFWIGLENY